jgi:flavin prenyltransferase
MGFFIIIQSRIYHYSSRNSLPLYKLHFMIKRKLIIAVTGASGAIYARELIDQVFSLKEQVNEVALVFTEQGRAVWEYELGSAPDLPFPVFGINDFYAPAASGSAGYDAMIICPCSMGTLGKIASGISDNLVTRAADVILKERKRLILVTRETPLNLIHLRNMERVTEAGGIIFPASPSFYSKPENISALTRTVTDRVLQLAGMEIESFRW